jgi:hypothetical protein
MLAAALNRWSAQATSQGWSVSGGRVGPCPCETGGWPFAASIFVPDLSLSGGGRLMPGGLSWSSGGVMLSVTLLHPRTLVIGLEGPQAVRVSHAPEISLLAASLTATVPLSTLPPLRADLRASGVEAGIAGSPHPRDVRIDDVQLHLELSDPTQLGLARGGEAAARRAATPGVAGLIRIGVRGIGLPDTGRWPLGGLIEHASGEIALTSPPMPFWDTEHGGGDPQAQAEAWRDGGGTLEVRDLDIAWGPLVMNGRATLRLDSRLQPAGTGTADIAGVGASLDALADAGILSAGLASTANALVMVMPHVSIEDGAAAGGTVSAVRLPFVLRDNTLSVGQIPLIQLHDIVWRRRLPM